MLNNHGLKYSPLNNLNDPFELMPGGYLLSDKTWNSYINYSSGEEQMLMKELLKLGVSAKYTAEELKMFYIERIHFSNLATEDKVKFYFLPLFVDMISKTYGVFCLSENPKSILMWSHYADSHNGVAIGLDTELLNNPIPVKYSDKRPVLDVDFSMTEEQCLAATKALIGVKAAEWKYEKEWRCVAKLSELTTIKFNTGCLFVKPFSLEHVKAVYFGTRTSESDISEIKNLFSNHHPLFYRLKYDDFTYSLKEYSI